VLNAVHDDEALRAVTAHRLERRLVFFGQRGGGATIVTVSEVPQSRPSASVTTPRRLSLPDTGAPEFHTIRAGGSLCGRSSAPHVFLRCAVKACLPMSDSRSGADLQELRS
jgi:hypothetical protein